MRSRIGMFVASDDNGSTVTDKVYRYDSYQEMVDDTDPGKYGIVDNTVYHHTDNGWVVGFSNIENDDVYSAFEVYAHDTDIPTGECEELGGYVNDPIPACMTHKFTLRIEGDVETNDVVVDWGDGITSTVSRNEYEDIVVYNDEFRSKDLLLAHTYKNTGKYIVKIYGKDYYTFRHHIVYFVDPDTGSKYVTDDGKYNLLCRIMEQDLPIAPHLSNCASMWRGAKRLLKIYIYATNNFRKTRNMTSSLAGCTNLIEALGFYGLEQDCSIGSIFHEDKNLEKTDIVVPVFASNISSMCRNCGKLAVSISDMFTSDVYPYLNRCTDAFINCKLLTGTVNPEVFWDNKFVKHVDGSSGTHYRTFTNCNLIKDQVPVSWGGTMEE